MTSEVEKVHLQIALAKDELNDAQTNFDSLLNSGDE
jgi:hypothetical protein